MHSLKEMFLEVMLGGFFFLLIIINFTIQITRFFLAKISILTFKCCEKSKNKKKKNPPSITSRNISFNECIFWFYMILLRVILITSKQLFFESPPEIHRNSLIFQY